MGNLAQGLSLIECSINEFYVWKKTLNIEVGPETKKQIFKKGMTNQNSKANKSVGKIFSAGVMGWAMLHCFGHVLLFVTPWTVALQAPLPMGILQARILE